MSHDPQRDPTAWIRFHNYEKGWRHGSAGRVEDFLSSKNGIDDVRISYNDGFLDGREARLDMHAQAAKRYGYQPNAHILREAKT